MNINITHANATKLQNANSLTRTRTIILTVDISLIHIPDMNEMTFKL